MNIISKSVEVTTKKLNCKVTQEMIDDLKNYKGIDWENWKSKEELLRLDRKKKLEKLWGEKH